MGTEILCAIISGSVTLVVAVGTWHFTAKKDKVETEKLFNEKVEDLKDSVSAVNATVQQQMAVMNITVQTLSDRVDKHNSVIERTYKLEQKVEDLLKIS